MSSFNHQISFQISSLHQAYIIFHGELASSCQNHFPSNPPHPPYNPLCQTFNWTIFRGGLLCLSLSLSFSMYFRTFQLLGWAPFFEFVDVSVFCLFRLSLLCNPGRLKVKGRVSSRDKKMTIFKNRSQGRVSVEVSSEVWKSLPPPMVILLSFYIDIICYIYLHPTPNGNIIIIIYW